MYIILFVDAIVQRIKKFKLKKLDEMEQREKINNEINTKIHMKL